MVRGPFGSVRLLVGAAARSSVRQTVVIANDGPVALEDRPDQVRAPFGPRQGQVLRRVG